MNTANSLRIKRTDISNHNDNGFYYNEDVNYSEKFDGRYNLSLILLFRSRG